MCPFCPHVCSVFARVHGPCNLGLVKNGPSGADVAPGRLDQWPKPAVTATAFYDRIPSYQRVTALAGASRTADLVTLGDEETIAGTVQSTSTRAPPR
jgi:hypothetical protein